MKTSDYRRDFAAFSSAMELAHFRHRAGLEPKLQTEPIYERYSELFTRDSIRDLERALDSTPPEQETERAGAGALLDAARMGFLDAHAKELTDECALCQSNTKVEWEGEAVPFNNVAKIIANEPVAARRHELAARWVDAVSYCNDIRAARFESLHESARELGFDSYRALYSEIMATDYSALSREAERFLERTDAAYRAALVRATARINSFTDDPRTGAQLGDARVWLARGDCNTGCKRNSKRISRGSCGGRTAYRKKRMGATTWECVAPIHIRGHCPHPSNH